MNFHLLTHNVLFLVGGLINIGVAIFVLYFTRKNRTAISTTFIFACLSVSVYQFSQLLGVNAADAVSSRDIFMFNANDLLIGIFMAHWFLALGGKVREQRFALTTIYVTGLGLLAYFIAFPRMFMVDSVPKMYFPFYYEPGPLYILMYIWFMIVAVYQFYHLWKSYRAETDLTQKNRLKYVVFAMTIAYMLGTCNFLLVFDIPFDPAIASFFGLYPLVLAYAMFKYELLDIRIFAKRAFIYLVTIFSIGAIIIAIQFLGNYITNIQPDFPPWVIPTLESILLGSGGVYIWKKSRETDISKYEFITVVTHKFRTPLTRIKWAAEEVLSTVPPEKKVAIENILASERQLLEMTDMIVRLAEADSTREYSKLESIHTETFFRKIQDEYAPRMSAKHIVFSLEVPAQMFILANTSKLGFTTQILLDNAMNYTPSGGSVSVKVYMAEGGKQGVIEISDTGIGMSKDTLRHIFTRFYRSEKALHADTEGLGIGLNMAKNLVEEQGGQIFARSAGENKGSVFSLLLPLAQKRG